MADNKFKVLLFYIILKYLAFSKKFVELIKYEKYGKR